MVSKLTTLWGVSTRENERLRGVFAPQNGLAIASASLMRRSSGEGGSGGILRRRRRRRRRRGDDDRAAAAGRSLAELLGQLRQHQRKDLVDLLDEEELHLLLRLIR